MASMDMVIRVEGKEFLGIYAQIVAEHALVLGMQAENDARRVQGLSPAYSEGAFTNSARHLRNLARHLEGLSNGAPHG